MQSASPSPYQEPGAVAPRISAAVMLTREVDGELEVYFARRSPALRFFGGSWAFPGGVQDDVDVELAGGEGEAALLACGQRELFEEVGVLAGGLAGRRGLREDWDGLRSELGQRGGPSQDAVDAWRGLCRAFSSDGSLLDGLRPIGLITTPAFRPLRYRTLFLHAALPDGETPTIVSGELVAGEFAKPRAVLDAWKRGEREVVPPVLFLLEILIACGDPQTGVVRTRDLERFFERSGQAMQHIAAGRLHSAFTSPGILAAPLRTPTLPPAMTTNAYLVGTEHIFVIDPGTYDTDELERLFDTLDRWQAQGRRIAGVLLTHQHGDHVGGVSAVCARYSVPLLAHPLTLAALEPRWDGGQVPSLAKEAGITPRLLGPKPRDVRELEDGARFELGASADGRPGWQLVARHTPGHARGHLVFVDERYGTLIVGDMASTISTIVIDPPEGHLATYLASLERLLELGAACEVDREGGEWNLLPAHGPWTSRGAALVQRYLEHRGEREASLLRALDKGLATRAEIVAFVYADTDERLWPVADRSLLAGLIKLHEQGRANVPAELLVS